MQIMLIICFLLWQPRETFVSFIVYKVIDLCPDSAMTQWTMVQERGCWTYHILSIYLTVITKIEKGISVNEIHTMNANLKFSLFRSTNMRVPIRSNAMIPKFVSIPRINFCHEATPVRYLFNHQDKILNNIHCKNSQVLEVIFFISID